MAAEVTVGTRVRVRLANRRVGGWVVRLGPATTDRSLAPLAALSGRGPGADVVELAWWAAWRWAGRPAHFLATASPERVVRALPPPARPGPPGERPPGTEPPGTESPGTEPPGTEPVGGEPAGGGPTGGEEAAAVTALLDGGGGVLRLPPALDPEGVVAAAARWCRDRPGDLVVLAPSVAEARLVAAGLRRRRLPVATLPDGWGAAAAGGSVVVGTRVAAWAPVPDLAAVIVLGEADEAHQSERSPTWHGRDVARERARRAGVPCVLVSAAPSLEALVAGPLVVLSRPAERAGWAALEVVDRRGEAPGLGLFSPRLVALAREAAPERRLVCVLNRKGRARLVACADCGALARCERCGSGLGQGPVGEGLACPGCGAPGRPAFCTACGSQRLKGLRPGVARAAEELELLTRTEVGEVTGEAPAGSVPSASVLVGTEAVLHRVAGAGAVAFLDFDQELLAPRYRAAEQALGLLARASRLVGGRRGRVLVQTRVPDHESLDAARHADPGRLAAVEGARRAALGLPPERALAAVSGPAAEAHVARLGDLEVDGLELAELGGRRPGWLVRAPDHQVLCDALAAAGRPPGRLRVAVDPLRV